MSVKKYLFSFFFLFIQGIKQVMKTKYHMEGIVNGHEFTIEGVGTGNPYEYVSLRKQNIINYFIRMHLKPRENEGKEKEASAQDFIVFIRG